MEDRRIKACLDFCAGVNTEALEGNWGLYGILRVMAELSRVSPNGVAKNLATSIMRCMGDSDDRQAHR